MKPIDKLKDKLAELFQLDQADLDFGIYRIMNAKREEITRFLDKDLLPQVQEAFNEYKSSDKTEIQKELDQVVAEVKAAGMDPEQSPKVKELRQRLAEEAVDTIALENEVFSHLYDFFRRYYDEGDFISMRRYKEGVYAIPYEGEEVKLHWANHDQYYIKTAEYFRDYSFRLSDGRRVHFRIIEADTEKDNVKATNGKDRRFFLHVDKPVIEENGELVIRFEYGPDAEKRKQDDLNIETAKTILAEKKVGLQWKAAFTEKWRRADGTVTDRTILEKHLFDYTRRNTFDYFIHRDLGKFLRRELDFYIKNEVMHLDDVENESAPRVEQYLSKIKVIRRISHKIIDFLAQIEDFQKKLWLKKKFVVETNYCVTLDRVPEELYPEIAENDAQREEWVRLFAIDEIKGDLTKPGYSKPLTAKFLKANRFLVVDTKFFPLDFKDKLLSAKEILADEPSLDVATNGLLVRSECFQALNFLQSGFAQSVDCGFIDPPYNTGSDGFPYKDAYQHSSWYSMLSDRMAVFKTLLRQDALFSCNIDDHELYRLGILLNSHLGENNRAACAPWKSEASGGKEKTGLRTGHEYLLIYHNGDPRSISQAERSTGELDREDKSGRYRKGRELRKWGGTSLREDRPGQWYALTVPNGERVWPIRNDGKDGHWRWGPKNPSIIAALKDPDFFHWELTPYDSGVVVDSKTERWVPYERIRDEKKSVGWSTWLDNYGSNADATRTLKDLFGFKPFETPKPVSLYLWLISLHANENSLVIDFFAGSGPVGHAVIESNRENGSGENRKYILVEMGDSFDTVLKPRIQKVVYSKDWKDGKPVSREGVSHMFKYICLESYEDALANLQLKQTEAQESLLKKSDLFRESYMLRYMLDTETKGSSSLLDLDQFEDPFSYKLLIGTGSVGETKPVNVDLVETFNWLLGLKVKHMDHIEGFRVVEGRNPRGEKVLVIWRKIRDLSEKDTEKAQRQLEKSNEDLEAFFKKQQYNTMDMEFDIVYVNGDNNLMNLPMAPEGEGLEPRYKVRLIEEEFKRLMFDVKDV